MLKKCIFFFVFPLFCFSQTSFNLSGFAKDTSNPLADVIVELQIRDKSFFSITNKNGEYKFVSINCPLNDSINLKVKKFGYEPFINTFLNDKENYFFDIVLEKLETKVLNEVIINGNNSIDSADKSIYKINQKEYIKNAKATEVLNKIPGVFYNESNGVVIDGNLKAKIFIDGIESLPNEIKSIKVIEIDKIEIISNPSSIYGTDFIGAIINIILKKTEKEFFNSTIGSTGGIKNNEWAIYPGFKYKKGILSFKSDFAYFQNNILSTDNIVRKDFNNSYNQNSISNSNTIQYYFNSILNLNFSKKSDLTVKAYNGGFKIDTNLLGSATLDNELFNYVNNSETDNDNLELASVFKYKFNDRQTIYVKNLYQISKDIYQSEFNNSSISFFDVRSRREEITFNINYQLEKYQILKKQTNISNDLRYVKRKFTFFDNNFFLDQNILNFTSDVSTKWGNKLSTQLALTFEHSINKNDEFFKEYNLLLPTFNSLYKFKNKINARFGFSQKILRPNPSDLNETLIVNSPGNASQGNSNLNQQKRNYYFLSLKKEFEIDNLTLKLFRSTINNSIVNVYKKNGDLLIKTLNNASTFNSTGFNFDYLTNLFNKVDVNINSGLTYDVYKSDDITTVIRENNGFSYNSSLSISSNLFKDKVSVSFSGFFDGPNYTLLSRSIGYPTFDFTINTNLFKDKISLSLYANNLLGNNATIIRNKSLSDNFEQFQESRNNFTNLLLTITYNFGKYFEGEIRDNSIQNEDIRK